MDENGGDNAELLALHKIDETCMRLQQQGNYLEALETMERGLVLRQHFFGPSSEEVWSACETVGKLCNLLAMTYLQQEDFPMVLELLKKAEILTERDDRGRAVTYNNLACYYRRQGKLHAALKYLQKANKVEQQLTDVENRADTHLNLCAVLSQLGRHAGALEHAQSALILLQEELFPGPLSSDGTRQKKTAGVDRIAVLAIAYHNIGVEQEFMKRFDMALESYRKGVEISETHLGESHGITLTLRNSYLAAKKAVTKRTGGGRGQGLKGRGQKPGAARRKGNKKPGPTRVKSPTVTERDEKRWNNIQKAYGEVALDIKPKPAPSVEHNLQLGFEDEEEEDQQQKPKQQNDDIEYSPSPNSPNQFSASEKEEEEEEEEEYQVGSSDDEAKEEHRNDVASINLPKIGSTKINLPSARKNEDEIKDMITPRNTEALEEKEATSEEQQQEEEEEEETIETQQEEEEEEERGEADALEILEREDESKNSEDINVESKSAENEDNDDNEAKEDENEDEDESKVTEDEPEEKSKDEVEGKAADADETKKEDDES